MAGFSDPGFGHGVGKDSIAVLYQTFLYRARTGNVIVQSLWK